MEERAIVFKAAMKKMLFTNDGLLITGTMLAEIYNEGNGVINYDDYNVRMVEPLRDYVKNGGLTKDQIQTKKEQQESKRVDERVEMVKLLFKSINIIEDNPQLTTSEMINEIGLDNIADVDGLRNEIEELRLDTLLEDLDNELEEMDYTLEWVEKEWTPDLDEEDQEIVFEDMMIALFDITETLENALDQIKLITA